MELLEFEIDPAHHGPLTERETLKETIYANIKKYESAALKNYDIQTFVCLRVLDGHYWHPPRAAMLVAGDIYVSNGRLFRLHGYRFSRYFCMVWLDTEPTKSLRWINACLTRD